MATGSFQARPTCYNDRRSMISVEGITKTYGKKENLFTALNDVNFRVPQSSSVAITGKSGSGKSTLMHIMSGLERATSGRVMINDRDVQAMSRKEADTFRAKEMSFIFQSFFVEPNQTVYQNVVLPLEIAEAPQGRRRAIVNQALKAVELDDKINQKARSLSGGQKQRLAIARAMVNRPKLIFADEPTGNLDSATGDKIMKLLFQLTASMGGTLFIVTHDHDLAGRCQYQIRLHDGKVAGTARRPGQRLAKI